MLKKRCQFDAKFNEVFESGFKIFLRADLQLQLQHLMLKLKLKLKIDSRKKSEITLHMQCVFCVPGGGL